MTLLLLTLVPLVIQISDYLAEDLVSTLHFRRLPFHIAIQVAEHDAPIKTCHWIKSPGYSCLMTGSWDKTVKVSSSFGNN